MNTTNASWTPGRTTAGNPCGWCDDRVFDPLYWNVKREEVYCNAVCATAKHESLKSVENIPKL